MKHGGLVPYAHVANVKRLQRASMPARCSILFTCPWENFPSTTLTATEP